MKYPTELIEKAEYEVSVFERVSRDTGIELIEEVKRLRQDNAALLKRVWLSELLGLLTMPNFTIDFEFEFEVFCKCGNGLCNSTETRESRTRRCPQAVVEPCEICLAKQREEAEEEVKSEMQRRIDELENELEFYKQKNAA